MRYEVQPKVGGKVSRYVESVSRPFRVALESDDGELSTTVLDKLGSDEGDGWIHEVMTNDGPTLLERFDVGADVLRDGKRREARVRILGIRCECPGEPTDYDVEIEFLKDGCEG